MRMIDADRLKAEIMGWCVVTDDLFGMGKYHEREIVLQAIEESPTIDAVPVVRGKWKMDTDPDDGDCRCSSCKVCIDALHSRNHGVLNALGYKLHTFYKYCPRCGAKMEDKQ